MILDEDPASVKILYLFHKFILSNNSQLIQHTVENFNIQPDKLALSRINESLTTLQQARDLRIRECRSTLNSQSFIKFVENLKVDNRKNYHEL